MYDYRSLTFFFYWNLSTGDILELKNPTFQATMAPRIVKACTVNWFRRAKFFFSFTVPLMWHNIYSRFKYTSSSPTVRVCGMSGLRSEHVLITFRTNSVDSTHQRQARRTQTPHFVSNTFSRCHSYYHGLQSDSFGPIMPFYIIRAFNGRGQFITADESFKHKPWIKISDRCSTTPNAWNTVPKAASIKMCI